MRYALVTLNIGSVLRSNARLSLQHAAHRWKADFIEIKKPLISDRFYPSYNKFLFRHAFPFSRYDQVVFIDPDVLVNIATPSIFAFPADSFCAVRDGDRFKDDKQTHAEMMMLVAGDHFEESCLYSGIPISKEVYLENFFNAGMFSFSPPLHESIFLDLEKIYTVMDQAVNKDFRLKNFLEQAIFNCAVSHRCKDKMLLLPVDWNYLEPPVMNGETSMQKWIYHFTGPVLHKNKHLIDRVDWTIPLF